MIPESTQQKTVADVMSGEVLTVESSTSIGEALEIMEEKRISALPVVDDNRCVGIVTATDVVRLIRELNGALQSGYPHYEDCLWAVDLAHHKLDQQPVREVMSVCVEKVTPETSICEAAKRLSSSARHHLVVESDGELIGFLSSWDLTGAIC